MILLIYFLKRLTSTVAIWVQLRQSARMSKITNDGLTRSGTWCFIAVPMMAAVGVKGLTLLYLEQMILG